MVMKMDGRAQVKTRNTVLHLLNLPVITFLHAGSYMLIAKTADIN